MTQTAFFRLILPVIALALGLTANGVMLRTVDETADDRLGHRITALTGRVTRLEGAVSLCVAPDGN